METKDGIKQFELNESIPDRDWDFEREQNGVLYQNYVDHYIEEIKRMQEDKAFVLDNSFNGVKANHHIMYKCNVNEGGETLLMTSDGCIGYEFLVEFDLENPEYGIYYGCRGHIKDGNQKEGIDRIETFFWDTLRPEVTAVLNNTFVDKDFSRRFQKTNNANNKTYWPFWIALGADEDIVEVAARATKLIRNVYRLYINKSPCCTKRVEKEILVRTNYTEAAYQDIIKQLKDSAGEDLEKGKERVKNYKLFIARLVDNCHISVDVRYERCWKFKSLKKTEVHYLIEKFCKNLLFKDDAGLGGNPWKFFSPVFLSKDETDFSNIRTSTTKRGEGFKYNHAKTMKKVDEVYNGLNLTK